jgi:tetratricopeptide (TPR) repeat protein
MRPRPLYGMSARCGERCMARVDALERGRAAFGQRKWRQAYAQFSAAERESSVEPGDLERYATAAYMLGKDAEAAAVWARAHHASVDCGQWARAARCGFWLSLTRLLRGEIAKSTGWLARTQRLLDSSRADCVEQGYLALLRGLLSMGRGEAGEADSVFTETLKHAARFSDLDLKALSLLGRGQASIQMQLAEGAALLDEAMVEVTTGEVSPLVSGIVYCAVILSCQQLFDVARAREWTAALAEWCAAQPELVSFRGQCLLHRAEIMQMRGEWRGAATEAQRACEQAELSESAGGPAFYRRAELHRLRGQFEEAERLYREAGLRGYDPQPGLSRLRLSQGDPQAAAASIRSRSCSRSAISRRRRTEPRHCRISPLASMRLYCARSRLKRGAPCVWPAGKPRGPLLRYATPGPVGSSSPCLTSPRESASLLPSPAETSTITTPRGFTSTRRRRSSSASAPRRPWTDSRSSPGARLAAISRHSPVGSWKCWRLRPPARRTVKSRARCSSASTPSRVT